MCCAELCAVCRVLFTLCVVVLFTLYVVVFFTVLVVLWCVSLCIVCCDSLCIVLWCSLHCMLNALYTVVCGALCTVSRNRSDICVTAVSRPAVQTLIHSNFHILKAYQDVSFLTTTQRHGLESVSLGRWLCSRVCNAGAPTRGIARSAPKLNIEPRSQPKYFESFVTLQYVSTYGMETLLKVCLSEVFIIVQC